MTALTLRWRKPAPPLLLRWRGPDARVSAAAQASPLSPIAAIIGPPGPRLGERIADINASPFNPDIDLFDFFRADALDDDLVIENPTGTPGDFWRFVVRIRDNGTSRQLAWGSAYLGGTTPLPSQTPPNKVMHLGFGFDASLGRWCLLSVTTH